jgi:phage replication O-like protein O
MPEINDNSPQLENGYIKIANEIMDALAKTRIPGVERQCLDFILRKTYGFNKKQDSISLSQFVKATGIKKPNIIVALNGLLSKKIIKIIKNHNKTGKVYEFNKHYNQWQPLPKKKALLKNITGVIKKHNKSLLKTIPTKDNSTKDNITKDITTSKVSENNIPLKLSKKLFYLILKNDPKAKTPNFNQWAAHIEKLIRIDKRTPDEISHVIQWTQQDEFWMSNILSTAKLRKSFQQLWLKSNKPTKSNQRFRKNVQAMEDFLNG